MDTAGRFWLDSRGSGLFALKNLKLELAQTKPGFSDKTGIGNGRAKLNAPGANEKSGRLKNCQCTNQKEK